MNTTILLKRLEILKNYIVLEDIEEIERECTKILPHADNVLASILQDILAGKYASGTSQLQNYLTDKQQITTWEDPEIAAAKLEIKQLEELIASIESDKAEAEKLLQDFNYRHSTELGELIIEILHLRTLLAKDDPDLYDEARNEEEQYREQVKTEQEKTVFNLTEEEQKQLKKQFREATQLCHPDKFSNEDEETQKKATAVFQELKKAYDNNDMATVATIYNNLKRGILSTEGIVHNNDKLQLLKIIEQLKQKIAALQAEIVAIKESDAYRSILAIENWDDYFIYTRQTLEQELEYLKTITDTEYL